MQKCLKKSKMQKCVYKQSAFLLQAKSAALPIIRHLQALIPVNAEIFISGGYIRLSTEAQTSTLPLLSRTKSGVTQTRNDSTKENVTFLQAVLIVQAARA